MNNEQTLSGVQARSRTNGASPGGAFELGTIDHELRAEEFYTRDGLSARTLVRVADLRVVYVAMQAGSITSEHRARYEATLHVLSGRIRVRLRDRTMELVAGGLLVLEACELHEVEARTDSSMILSFGWHQEPEQNVVDDPEFMRHSPIVEFEA